MDVKQLRDDSADDKLIDVIAAQQQRINELEAAVERTKLFR
ncbi:MAG: hypothetical protein AAF802_15190 [Planctomycetota bacterium]